MRKVINAESVFILFVFSGAFKGSLTFIPFDVTVLLMIFSIVLTLIRVLTRGNISKYVIFPMLLFFVIYVLSVINLLWVDLSPYGMDKLSKFLVLTSWSFLAPLLLFNKQDATSSLKRYIYTIATISVVMLFFSLYEIIANKGYSGFLGVLGSNYLMLGRMIGILVIFLALSLIKDKMILRKKMFIFIVFLLSVYVLLISGGRMPVISLFICLSLVFLKDIRLTKSKTRISEVKVNKRILLLTPVVISLLGFLVYYLEKNNSTFWFRFKLLFNGGGFSANTRMSNFREALEMIKEKPLFGFGFGEFHSFTNSYSDRSYPHNILLEFLSEQGIFSFICIVILLILPIIIYIKHCKNNNNKLIDVSFVIYLFILVNSMVSGDINDNRVLFAFISICTTTPFADNEKIKLIKNKSPERLVHTAT